MKGWFNKSILLLFLISVQDIMHRYLMKEGYKAIELVLYGFLPTLIATLVYIHYKKIKLVPLNYHSSIVFLITGILSFVGFMLLRTAQLESPNIGYVLAISYSSVLLTILLTALIYKDSISINSFSGSVLIIIGIYMVSINGVKEH
jgi:drug/metabolite transporter (DMT)-like permease